MGCTVTNNDENEGKLRYGDYNISYTDKINQQTLRPCPIEFNYQPPSGVDNEKPAHIGTYNKNIVAAVCVKICSKKKLKFQRILNSLQFTLNKLHWFCFTTKITSALHIAIKMPYIKCVC